MKNSNQMTFPEFVRAWVAKHGFGFYGDMKRGYRAHCEKTQTVEINMSFAARMHVLAGQ